MATKHTLTITISGRGGNVLDLFQVFTTDPAKTVEQITNSIENQQWTDEDDFDEYLKEMEVAS